MQLTVSGIPVEVLRKKIKHMHLYVLPPDGSVRVTAPKKLTDAQIAIFVQSKLGWIQKQRARIALLPRPVQPQYVSGETLFVWGKPYALQVQYGGRRNTLTLEGDRALLTVREKSTAAQREAFVYEWYRAQLKAEAEKYLPKWEQITGLSCNSFQIKNMKTRWGTCNPKSKKVWLSLQLAKKPVPCLEYILLHELAHLLHQNHGAKFTSFLDRHMPNWREIKKELNDKSS
jgi:predicted metal-dependent hydrolase